MLGTKPTAIALDIEYDFVGMTGYALYNHDVKKVVQIVDEKTNSASLYPIKDPDEINLDGTWTNEFIDVINFYDIVIGCNIHNDITKFQPYQEVYDLLKKKSRCIGKIFGHLNDKRNNLGRRTIGSLLEIMNSLDVTDRDHHDPLFDAKVCMDYYYSIPDIHHYLDVGKGVEKKTCPGCKFEFAGLSSHKKRCKLFKGL